MFTTFIVQPIFNVLTVIYALIPGHNFGIAIIIFTILARFALFPMLKKQLRHTKAMRDLQPEIKKIKASNKGDKQQESRLTMELYKEREIKPLANLGLMAIQLVLFLALFEGINRVVRQPQEIYNFSYPTVQKMDYMKEINSDISKFDNTLLGSVDLGRAAISGKTALYLPALLLVFGSAIIQFFQIRQTMPSEKQSRKLRQILKDAGSGKQADSSEVNAAMGRNISYFMPIIIFIFTVSFPAGLSLYWFVGGLVAYMQQSRLLKQDEYSMTTATAVVVSKKPLRKSNVKVTSSTKEAPRLKNKKTKNKSARNRKKRRR